jgi:DNA-directed RNA polymerase III subunit RPC2
MCPREQSSQKSHNKLSLSGCVCGSLISLCHAFAVPPKKRKEPAPTDSGASEDVAATLAALTANVKREPVESNDANEPRVVAESAPTATSSGAATVDAASAVKSETKASGGASAMAVDGGEAGDDELFNSSKLHAPIKDASEKWTLVPAFLKLHGLVRQHIDSYDYFVNEGMKQIMLANKRIESDQNPNFYLEYKDIWIGEPRIEETSHNSKNITPQLCRLRDLTYAAPIYVTVEYVRGRSVVVRKGLLIGRMPVMLRSSKCVLLGLSDEQLVSAGECTLDPGGYFVVRGTEKVILIQEQLSKNRIIIEHDSKGCLAASVTSSAFHFKSRFQIVREKDGVLRARHNNIDDINAVVMLRALGVQSEAAAALMVGPELIEALAPTLAEAALLGVSTEIEALDYVGSHLRQQAQWRKSKARIDEARNALIRVVLGHVPTSHHDLREKAAFVALMMRRVLLAADDTARVDDRDYYGNKRLELAGDLLSLLFEDLFKTFNSLLKRNIDKTLEKHHHVHQFDALKHLRADTITNGLSRAISTGNWNVKRFKMERAGVTAVLSRLSFIAALGMMTRITSQFEKTRKISGPRALQPSQFGVLCPSDTPEGESCGLVKNLALLTHVTTGDHEAPLRRVAFNLGVNPLLCAGPAALTARDAHLVLLNGNLLGVHPNPRQLARTFRRLRRAGLVGEFVSIHVDERERCMHIASDGGRLCRPLLVCRAGRPLLDRAHLAALAAGELNFGDLLVSGVVEFVDVNEENDCLIAVTESDLRRETTHLEIAPFTMLGVVAGLIPNPHHNQSPRNTYQCAMGKQAMGNIAFNQQQRLDTVLYLLSYAQKPMVRTRTIELIGFNELPAGANASIAVMSYSGYDIEDALVLNKAALDRGYGRCAVMRKQTASARKYPNQTGDRFEYPTTVHKDHASLDRDGIAYPGVRVAPHQTLISKKVPLNTTQSVSDLSSVQMSDSFTRLDVPEPIIVDQVVVTSSEEEHWLVKMLLRSTRRPELGDKFSSRHGQKGVVGLIANAVDLPFSERGVTFDMIMNPHGFPSRMTVGKMIELVAGKAGVLGGKFKYGTAFGNDSAASCGVELIARGYSYAGKDVLTSGITGEMMPAYVFCGPMFYQKLKHMVMDKMHARSTGPRTVLTRQPTEGRSRDGGLRLGEMERDCLTEEHQVLTDRGFLFLAEIEAYAGVAPLRFASVDADALVYERATELIVKPAVAGQILYEFTHHAGAATWAPGSEPCERDGSSSSNHVSFVVTGGHDVYCMKGRRAAAPSHRAIDYDAEGFRKFKAEALFAAAVRGDGRDALQFKGKLAGGLADGRDLPPELVGALRLTTPAHRVAFCELYGFLRGDASLSCTGACVVQRRDVEWLHASFATLGLELGKAYECSGAADEIVLNVIDAAWARLLLGDEWPSSAARERAPPNKRAKANPVADTSRFAAWVWRLRIELARAIVAGLRRADGTGAADQSVVRTSSARFRDELVRLGLHSGYAARFCLASCGAWAVAYADGAAHASPVLCGKRDIKQVAYSGRTWCVSLPHGLIITRRAHVDATSGVVLKASLPVVMGNCLISYGASNLLVERLMISSDQFDVHACRACGFMGYEGWCQYCKSAVDVTRLTLPYAVKLLFQELQSMNVVPKLKLESL